jgi:hypothetical protein
MKMLGKAKVRLLRNVKVRSANLTAGGRTGHCLRAGNPQPVSRDLESDAESRSQQQENSCFLDYKRSELRNGLTARQRVFILEKLVGLSDKDAALAAGYSLSVAENTKQRIWKPRVREEFERLRLSKIDGIRWPNEGDSAN